MKKRVFYVVNLDRNRIFMMGVLAVGFLLVAFATGFRFGVGSPEVRHDYSDSTDNSRQGLERSIGHEESRDELKSSDSQKDLVKENRETSRETARDLRDQKENKAEKTDTQSQLTRMETEKHSSRETETTREKEKSKPTAHITSKEETKTNRTVKTEKPAKTEKRNHRRIEERTEEKPKEKVRRQNADKTKPRESARSEEKPHAPRSTAEVKPSDKSAEKPKASQEKPARREAALLETEGKIRMANAGQKTMSLQLGSFTSKGAADRMDQQLKKQGFDSRILKQGNKYLVRTGKSVSTDEIDQIEAKLRQKNYSAIRVSGD